MCLPVSIPVAFLPPASPCSVDSHHFMSQQNENNVLRVLSENRAQLMGVAMLSIMLFHQQFIGQGKFVFEFFHSCGHWGVDMFMFLSGMGCYYAFRKAPSVGCFYKRRLRRIMPSAVCAGVIKVLIIGFLWHQSFHVNACLRLFGLDLWFIRSILILYLLFPVFVWGLQRFNPVCFLLSLMAFCILFLRWFDSLKIQNWIYYTTVAWTLYRLPVFVLGILVSLVGGGDKSLKINRLLQCVALAVFCFLVFNQFFAKIYFPQFCLPLKDEYAYFLLSLPITVLAYYAGSLLRGRGAILRWIGTHSLELYLVHEFVYWLVGHFRWPFLGRVVFLLAIAVSFIAAYLLKKMTAYALNMLRVR